jgi:hypothetical protein
VPVGSRLRATLLTGLSLAAVLLFAAPAGAYDWIDSGPVSPSTWGLNGPNNHFDKINGFYFGSGSFKLCVRKSSPAYPDIKRCGYAYEALPQARIADCGGLWGKPGLWNGDNGTHNFEIRSYFYC